MEIVGEYSDEGHSGKNIKGRHGFMRMLGEIEESKDGVEVKSLYLNCPDLVGMAYLKALQKLEEMESIVEE